jgi:hypothetical protein
LCALFRCYSDPNDTAHDHPEDAPEGLGFIAEERTEESAHDSRHDDDPEVVKQTMLTWKTAAEILRVGVSGEAEAGNHQIEQQEGERAGQDRGVSLNHERNLPFTRRSVVGQPQLKKLRQFLLKS